MSDEKKPITLEFLGAQMRQMIDQLGLVRAQLGVVQDDIRVLSAMAMRQDNANKTILDLLDRHDQRIRRLEPTA